MDMTYIKNLAKSFFKGRSNEIEKKQKFCLNIGKMEARLDMKRRIRLQSFSGRTMSVSSLESSWRKEEGACLIVPEEEPNPHMIITGMSGMGKSTLLRSLLGDIARSGTSAIMFDAHNEHFGTVRALGGNAYDAKYAGVNIFDLDGLSVGERGWEVSRLLGSVFGLGHIQTSKLLSCIQYIYKYCGSVNKGDKAIEKVPTIANLVYELGVFAQNARTSAEAATIQNMKSKIEMLNLAAFSRTNVPLGSLLKGVNSISLQNLSTSEARQVYIHELLRRLYFSMKHNEKERGIRLYVMMDEAQSLMAQSDSGAPVASIIQEGRKYGVGAIMATHLSSALDRQIVANAAAFVAFHSREPHEVNYVASLLSGCSPRKAEAIKTMLNDLGQNCAVVVSGVVRSPVMVRTPSVHSIDPKIRGVHDYVMPADADTKCKILEFLNRPVLESVASAFLGGDFAAVDRMIADKAINRLITDDIDGKQVWLMRSKYAPTIEHEAYVLKISKQFERFNVRSYIAGGPSKPDLVAYIGKKKVAVEYETGRRNLDDSFKMFFNRLDRFDYVVAVVNETCVDEYMKKAGDKRIIVVTYEQLVRGLSGNSIIPTDKQACRRRL
jgi:energy-coupling factor transporter ATP-binding protein EcfA2